MAARASTTLHGSKDAAVVNGNMAGVKVAQESRAFQDTDKRWGPRPFKKIGIHTNIQRIQERGGPTGVGEEAQNKEWTELKLLDKEPVLDTSGVLLMIQEIRILYSRERKICNITSFFNIGSSCPLIQTAVAEGYKLLGHPITITIVTVNGKKTTDTKIYIVELMTAAGERRLIRAHRIQKISDILPFVEIDGTKNLFSKEVHEVWDKLKRSRQEARSSS